MPSSSVMDSDVMRNIFSSFASAEIQFCIVQFCYCNNWSASKIAAAMFEIKLAQIKINLN